MIQNISIYNFRFIWLALILLLPYWIVSQTPHKEEITIIAPYEPSIRDANKINVQPRIEQQEIAMPPVEISINPRKLLVNTSIESIQAANVPAEKPAPLYRNHLKAGLGNYKTPYIEFTANSLRKPGYLLGLHLKHLSSTGQINNYGYSAFSDNLAEIFGQNYFENFVLGSSVYYHRNVVHHYGFIADNFPMPTYELTEKNIRQRFNQAGGSIKLGSSNKNTDGFHHNTKLDYHCINDLFKTSEHEIEGNTSLKASFDFFSFFDSQQTILNLGVARSTTNDSLAKFNNTLIRIKPVYHFRFQEYEVKAGFGLEFDHDTSTHWHFFPMLEAKLALVQNKFSITAGLDGKVQKNTFRTFATENPFLHSVQHYKNQTEKIKFYGILAGSIAGRVDLSANIAYSWISSSPFFVNDSIAPFNRFYVLYDDLKLFRTGFSASVKVSEIIEVTLEGNYYKYTMDTEAEAWHKPQFDARLQGNYKVNDKLALNTSIIANGKSWARVWNGSGYDPHQLKAWLDISAGARYQLNKQLHFFLDARNLTANKHFYWYNYPSQGINVMAGAGFSF